MLEAITGAILEEKCTEMIKAVIRGRKQRHKKTCSDQQKEKMKGEQHKHVKMEEQQGT